jgi:SNF family Na+-dependent transporter
VALTGLTAGALNEFCEVILAGSIVVPATFVFLGATGAIDVAESGIFHVGFVTLPMILGQLPMGFIFSGLWFLLLFIAAITSSVSLIQPAIAFFEDEFGWSRNRTVLILAATAFIICQPIIFFQQHGIIDELDFWSGTFFLVLFATCEVILFGWIFGIDRGWKELHVGAKINVPVVFKFIIKYVTPLYLLGILGAWFIQKLWPTLLLKNIAKADFAYLMGARIIIVLLFLIFFALVTYAWKNRKKEKN